MSRTKKTYNPFSLLSPKEYRRLTHQGLDVELWYYYQYELTHYDKVNVKLVTVLKYTIVLQIYGKRATIKKDFFEIRKNTFVNRVIFSRPKFIFCIDETSRFIAAVKEQLKKSLLQKETFGEEAEATLLPQQPGDTGI